MIAKVKDKKDKNIKEKSNALDKYNLRPRDIVDFDLNRQTNKAKTDECYFKDYYFYYPTSEYFYKHEIEKLGCDRPTYEKLNFKHSNNSYSLNDHVTVTMDELIAYFKHFDIDKGGSIDKNEAILMGESLGLSREEMVGVFNEIDINGDNELQMHEWVDWVRNLSADNNLKIRIMSKLNNKSYIDTELNVKYSSEEVKLANVWFLQNSEKNKRLQRKMEENQKIIELANQVYQHRDQKYKSEIEHGVKEYNKEYYRSNNDHDVFRQEKEEKLIINSKKNSFEESVNQIMNNNSNRFNKILNTFNPTNKQNNISNIKYNKYNELDIIDENEEETTENNRINFNTIKTKKNKIEKKNSGGSIKEILKWNEYDVSSIHSSQKNSIDQEFDSYLEESKTPIRNTQSKNSTSINLNKTSIKKLFNPSLSIKLGDQNQNTYNYTGNSNVKNSPKNNRSNTFDNNNNLQSNSFNFGYSKSPDTVKKSKKANKIDFKSIYTHMNTPKNEVNSPKYNIIRRKSIENELDDFINK